MIEIVKQINYKISKWCQILHISSYKALQALYIFWKIFINSKIYKIT
jgi:hypothetical protein